MERGVKKDSNVYDFNKAKRRRKEAAKKAEKKAEIAQRRKRPFNLRRALNLRELSKLATNKRLLPIFGCAIILLLLIIIWSMTNKNAQAVYLGEEQIGIVLGNKLNEETLQETAVGKLKADLGVAVEVNETVSIKPVHAKKNEWVADDRLLADLASAFTYKVEAVKIMVGGIEFAIVKNFTEWNNIKSEIMKPYKSTDDDVKIIEEDFVENVSSVAKFVEATEVMSNDKVIDILTSETDINETYTVASGDSFWGIANRYKMTVDQLLTLNDLSENSILKVGQNLNVIVSKPLLSIKIVDEYTTTETERYTSEKNENHEMPKSYVKIITPGKNGEVKVTMRRTRINGILVSDEEFSREITVKPQIEIMEVGTQ